MNDIYKIGNLMGILFFLVIFFYKLSNIKTKNDIFDSLPEKKYKMLPIQLKDNTNINNVESNKIDNNENTIINNIESNEIDNIENTIINNIESNKIDNVENTIINNVESNEIYKVKSNEIDNVESNEIDNVESNEIDNVESNEIDKLEDNEIDKVEDNIENTKTGLTKDDIINENDFNKLINKKGTDLSNDEWEQVIKYIDTRKM